MDLNDVDDGAKDTTPTDPDFNPLDEDDILSKNLAKYPEFITGVLSCGLSNRKTAKLVNSLFVDLKVDQYVSPSKVRSLKEKKIKALNEKHERETKELIGIGVDGKNGMVKLPHCQSTSMDKQSMNNSVTGQYLDHGIPDEGTGEEICNWIYKMLVKYRSVETILLLNLDGCGVNTGCHSGVVRYLESKLCRPLTWIICCLHLNELVFTHLFKAIGECSILYCLNLV